MNAVVGSKTSSLAFKVVLYFARNPDEELTSADIAAKFTDNSVKDVSGRLRKYRAGGILNCVESDQRTRTGARALTWSAGPELLDMIK
mgnify:CR=1 FL=1